MKKTELQALISLILDQEQADGCVDCAFENCEEYEMPCAKCKRNSKDYWRYKASEY